MSRLREHFPDAVVLRERDGDVVLGDREISTHCGFISFREAEILRVTAEKYRGHWLEIGSHVGWSAAHIASVGNFVMAVDPEFARDTPIRERAAANWERAGAMDHIAMVGLTAAEFFAALGGGSVPRPGFNGVFIDGNHDAPEPLNDAINAAAALVEHGAIVMHDCLGQPVKDAVNWLGRNGFAVTIHETMQGLAVCER